MSINWLVIPTLAGSLVLFWLGQRVFGACRTFTHKLTFALVAVTLAVPGVLFAVYYLHILDRAEWFYEFRSLPFTELAAAGAGVLAGGLAELLKGTRTFSRPFLAGLLCFGVLVPHLKPVIAPLSSGQFRNRWQDDVCLQSTLSSCGAASGATVFKAFGVSLTEQNVARECFTYRGGTENWYLARAFRRRGLRVTYRIEKGFPADLKLPAIAGVRTGGYGHFVAILSKTGEDYVTGDPLAGRKTISADRMAGEFKFTGFFMEVLGEGAAVEQETEEDNERIDRFSCRIGCCSDCGAGR